MTTMNNTEKPNIFEEFINSSHSISNWLKNLPETINLKHEFSELNAIVVEFINDPSNIDSKYLISYLDSFEEKVKMHAEHLYEVFNIIKRRALESINRG